MSFMGVGTNVLGYANSNIDKQVIKSIKNSNMSTLNSNYEIFLAEKLIEIHKWAEMVRFARTGGEANSIAIRLARAFTKKDNVDSFDLNDLEDSRGFDDRKGFNILKTLMDNMRRKTRID